MPCYYPLTAYRCQDRSIVFRMPRNCIENLTLPCGQCVGCRLERSRQWAVRCMHEASLYKNNCFITLTYNDENLPSDRSLHKEHFQKFMKRLRKRFQGMEPVSKEAGAISYPIRFYYCGEYGENFGRPHYHALIFNFDFPDKKLWRKSPSGEMLYRSAELEKLWPYGYSSVGNLTFKSAAYTARYIMKKVNGKAADDHYIYVDEDGVIHKRLPEYTDMSRDGGIGLGWLKKYQSDVYPNDYVVVNGVKTRPPKFYDAKYEILYPLEMDHIKYERHLNSQKFLDDNSTDRLAVKEQVQLAKLKKLKRTLT